MVRNPGQTQAWTQGHMDAHLSYVPSWLHPSSDQKYKSDLSGTNIYQDNAVGPVSVPKYQGQHFLNAFDCIIYSTTYISVPQDTR